MRSSKKSSLSAMLPMRYSCCCLCTNPICGAKLLGKRRLQMCGRPAWRQAKLKSSPRGLGKVLWVQEREVVTFATCTGKCLMGGARSRTKCWLTCRRLWAVGTVTSGLLTAQLFCFCSLSNCGSLRGTQLWLQASSVGQSLFAHMQLSWSVSVWLNWT